MKITGFDELKRIIGNLQDKQIPYATALALTRTGQDVKRELEKEMARVFDRPTPYTLNSLYLAPATKQKLQAEVGLREFAGKGTPASKYLLPQIRGGNRRVKRFESALERRGILPAGMYATPGSGAQMDSYGNMSRGQIVQVLSYFQSFGEQGYKANMTDKGRRRLLKGSKRTGMMGYSYFAIRRKGRLAPGIYKKVPFSKGSAIKPVMLFTRAPSYSKRFDFYGVALRTSKARFQENFRAALAEAMRTAR